MTQLASDPALNTTTGQLTDLMVVLRPVTQTSGAIVYQPQNITATDWLLSVLLPSFAAILDALPTQDGTTSLFWNNAGIMQRTTGGGTLSGAPLTARAMQASFMNLQKSVSTDDPSVAGEVYNPGDGLVHWSAGTTS